jgi:DNA repair protein RadC
MRYLKKLEIKIVRGSYPKIIKDKLRFPKEVYKTFKNLKDHSQEVLIGLYLNSDLKLTNYNILTIGSENQTITPVKELFTHTP